MSTLRAVFAPRKDHKGMSTPSYAARWYLPLCLALVGTWAWGVTDANIVMWSSLTVMIATPALTIGWYLISLVSSRFEPLYLLEKAEVAHKAKQERRSTGES